MVNYGRHLLIEDGDELVPAVTRGRKLRPVCGDRVVWRLQPEGEAVVEEVSERGAVLMRHDAREGSRILAANVDILFVVMAARPEPDLALLDRYLIAGEALGLDAHLVFNKADLLDEQQRTGWMQRLTPYLSIGYPLHWSDAKRGTGLEELRETLAGHCGMLVGPSGAGKSTLIRALVPDHAPRTQTLSQASGQGQHTTTATRLYRLPASTTATDGGCIIDSPGVRDFRLWAMDPRDVGHYFREFRPHLGACRFADCRHLKEPGCAIRAGVKAGEISEPRYQSYQLLAEVMLEQERLEARSPDAR